MSRERTNVGVVIITVCVTAAGLVAGWFGVSRYFAPQTVSVEQEEAPEEAPAPRRRASRARTNGGARTEPQDVGVSSTDAAATDLIAENEASGASEDAEPSAGGDPEIVGAVATEPASESASAPVEAIVTTAAANDEADARTIMEQSQRRSEAKFYRYDGLLQSFDAKNKMTDKRWKFDRVGSNGKSKAVLRFTAPAEVTGVALLIHNHPERASDQWMWTPALQRDRRIALQDRSTRFFGTDFSFEDLEERDVEQYDYAMLGNDVVDGADCWKIETTPKRSRSSHYTRSIAWIRKDNYLQVRLDNFVEDEVVKRLTSSTIENIQGIWTARLLEMADLRRRTRTRLTLQEVSYNAPMNDRDFTLQAIRR
jgi:hypothetical protein